MAAVTMRARSAADLPGGVGHTAVNKVSRRLLWFLLVLFIVSFLDRIKSASPG